MTQIIANDGASERIERAGVVEPSPETSVVAPPSTPVKPRSPALQNKPSYDAWTRASADLAAAKGGDHVAQEATSVKEWLRQKLIDTPLGTPAAMNWLSDTASPGERNSR